ncbi:hypothetical protein ABPG72_012684 [Tetrahymena utriculariae]
MQRVIVSPNLQKIVPNCQRQIERKKQQLVEIYESDTLATPQVQLESQIFSGLVSNQDVNQQKNGQESRYFTSMIAEKPIQISEKFLDNLEKCQKFRDEKVRQSELVVKLDQKQNLFKPRSIYVEQALQCIEKINKRERVESADIEKQKILELNKQRMQELEDKRLNNLPTTIDEIEKIKEENVMVQYKGGAQIQDQPQNQMKQIENSHQRQISCAYEFNQLDQFEKNKNIFQDDYLQYISYNPTYDDDIHPKNKVNPLIDMSSLSRDLMIQGPNVKKLMVQNCVDILNLEDILINKYEIKVQDIINIVSERINQNQLKYIFSNKGVFDLAKQVQAENDQQQTKKKFYKNKRKRVSEFISYVNNIKELKEIDALQELKHFVHISNYKDQSTEANQFDIIEETKEEIDWALEDFYFIKQAKRNIEQFPSFFEGVSELQKAISKRFEDSLIDLLRIFLGVSKQDYYETKIIKYEDLIMQLKKIVKNPESIIDQKIQGHQKVKILYIFLKYFLPIVQKEEQIIEQIKQLHMQISQQQYEEKKEMSKPSYVKDYEQSTIKLRKLNQQKIFKTINKLQDKNVKLFK